MKTIIEPFKIKVVEPIPGLLPETGWPVSEKDALEK
jgi:hypothetical protein